MAVMRNAGGASRHDLTTPLPQSQRKTSTVEERDSFPRSLVGRGKLSQISCSVNKRRRVRTQQASAFHGFGVKSGRHHPVPGNHFQIHKWAILWMFALLSCWKLPYWRVTEEANTTWGKNIIHKLHPKKKQLETERSSSTPAVVSRRTAATLIHDSSSRFISAAGLGYPLPSGPEKISLFCLTSRADKQVRFTAARTEHRLIWGERITHMVARWMH